MKAARLHAYGERLRIEDVAEPKVEAPYDVIVRIGGAGLCRTDIHIIEGRLARAVEVKLPYTLGHESAGWVAELGSAVTNVAVGDPVLAHPLITCGFCAQCRAGQDSHCENSAFPGVTTDGGFAELLKTNARSLVRLDSDLGPQQACALADAGLAAYHVVKKAVATLHPGTTAVVIGAGGLGHIAIQCLKAVSAAQTIAIDVSEEALELARQLGADHTVLADGNQLAVVQQLTGGAGGDVVLDFVGEGEVVGDAIAMVRRAGTYYAVGYGGTLTIPTMDVVARELSLVGNLVGSYNELVELVALAANGLVRVTTNVYALDAIVDVVDELRAGRLRGRAILVPEAPIQ